MSQLMFWMCSVALAGQVSFEGEGHAYSPTFSVDGSWLSFEVNRYAGDVDLYVVQLQGDASKGTARPVALPGGRGAFEGSRTLLGPVWHPDGVLIFEGTRGQTRLYTQRPGGAAASELISSSELPGKLTFPAISRDGMHLAFVADNTGHGDVQVRDSRSAVIRPLTITEVPEAFPTYSLDGASILFSRRRSVAGGEDLFVVDAQGGPEVSLVDGEGDQTRPTAGPNGSAVFFDGARGQDTWDIAMVPSTGGDKRVLAKDVRLPLRLRPAVSADGKWVAWTYDDPSKGSTIQLTRIDGGKTVSIETAHRACGELALTTNNGRTLLAYTGLGQKAEWRMLELVDITHQLK